VKISLIALGIGFILAGLEPPRTLSADLSVRQRLQRAIDVSRQLAAKARPIDEASIRSLGLRPFEPIDCGKKPLLAPRMEDVETYRRFRPWASAYAANPIFLRPMQTDPNNLLHWPAESDTPELRKLLDDKDPAMRCAAAEALATLHQPEDVPRIGRLLNDNANGLPALGWNLLQTARPVRENEIVAGGPHRMRSWHDRSVAATARLGLRLMTGEDLTTKNFDAWWQHNRGGRDRVWYWQARITRELLSADARHQPLNAVRQRIAKELEQLPAELEAKIRLLAVNRYSTSLGVDLDAPLMGPFVCPRITSGRLLELLERRNIADDADWSAAYNTLITEVLGQADKFFTPDLAPQLKAIVEREHASVAAVIGLSHLPPPERAHFLDDPKSRDGWLRSKMRSENDVLVRGYFAAELVRVGLPGNWEFLKEQFFAETGWKDRTDVRQSILYALGDEPLTPAKRAALLELVLDKKFTPLWTQPNFRMGDGICRKWAVRAVNAFAGKELLTNEDCNALIDPAKSEKALAEVLRKTETLR